MSSNSLCPLNTSILSYNICLLSCQAIALYSLRQFCPSINFSFPWSSPVWWFRWTGLHCLLCPLTDAGRPDTCFQVASHWSSLYLTILHTESFQSKQHCTTTSPHSPGFWKQQYNQVPWPFYNTQPKGSFSLGLFFFFFNVFR